MLLGTGGAAAQGFGADLGVLGQLGGGLGRAASRVPFGQGPGGPLGGFGGFASLDVEQPQFLPGLRARWLGRTVRACRQASMARVAVSWSPAWTLSVGRLPRAAISCS